MHMYGIHLFLLPYIFHSILDTTYFILYVYCVYCIYVDVLIGLTILGYRYEGLRPQDFYTAMRFLKETMETEGGKTYRDRPSCQRFEVGYGYIINVYIACICSLVCFYTNMMAAHCRMYTCTISIHVLLVCFIYYHYYHSLSHIYMYTLEMGVVCWSHYKRQ